MSNNYATAGIKSFGQSEDLLKNLGIQHYTMRHLRIIHEFLESKETDLTNRERSPTSFKWGMNRTQQRDCFQNRGQGRLILRDGICQFCQKTKNYRKKNNKKEKSK